MGILDLKGEVRDVAIESVGMEGADIDTVNRTISASSGTITSPFNTSNVVEQGNALDQIELCIGVTPDLLNSTWVNEMYDIIALFALDMFWIFFISALIGCILKSFDKLTPNQEADMVHIIKRSLIASFMIYEGIPVIMTLLLMNQYICDVFGGGDSVIALLTHTLTSPKIGCALLCGTAGGIIWNAIFYTIRLLLIYISCIMWAIAWVLWIWDRTATFSVFLLTIIVVNIFLGAAMTLVYWVGTLAMLSQDSTMWILSWGTDVMGLIIMLIAGSIPILAFIFFIFNPTTFVKKTVYAVAAL